MFARDLTGSRAVLLIVSVDRIDCRQTVVHRRESEQAFGCRHDVTEAGFLGDDRPAGGEILCTPLTEPTTAEADVLVLGNGKLAARPVYIVAVRIQISGKLHRAANLPSVRLQ